MNEPVNGKIIDSTVKKLMETYHDDSGTNFIEVSNLPVREQIRFVLEQLFEVLFPGYGGGRSISRSNISYIVGDILCRVQGILIEQVDRALRFRCRMTQCDSGGCHEMAAQVTEQLIAELPGIREMLKTDVQAAFDGDPAAASHEEIVLSYPCITAIAAHRIAHELYKQDVPLIPRMMNEYAHRRTGIDINPGAKIGKYFFIDHGTGVVIGETAVIGERVQIYQGVTLGALAPAKGQSLRGVKRHPTIEDHVTIYAEATILGDIVIGEGATIGGNVSVKDSVEPGTLVAAAMPELIYKKRRRPKTMEA